MKSPKEKLSDLKCNANGELWLQDWTTVAHRGSTRIFLPVHKYLSQYKNIPVQKYLSQYKNQYKNVYHSWDIELNTLR